MKESASIGTPIVLDIETVPDDPWLAATEADWISALEPPANYKNQDAIQRWVEGKVADRRAKASLSPLDGKVVAIAAALLWDDDGEDSLPVAWADHDEAEVLGHLSAHMRLVSHPIIAGWYVRIFDLPFLAARYARHGIAADWIPDPRDWRAVIEASDVLQTGKLGAWLARFGLPAKVGDGVDITTMSLPEIRDYCSNDVRVERALLRRLAPVFPSLRRSAPEVTR